MTTPTAIATPQRAHNAARIYLASSWRNPFQQHVVRALRAAGHEVYDFKHPTATAERGFHWGDTGLVHSNPIDGDPAAPDLANAAEYVAALDHPAAVAGFERDFAAMRWADTFVAVLPCGRSAHLELGWAIGAGRRTAVLLDDPCTPELMYRMVDHVSTDIDDLRAWLASTSVRQHPQLRSARRYDDESRILR